jgi:hypothetical protein
MHRPPSPLGPFALRAKGMQFRRREVPKLQVAGLGARERICSRNGALGKTWNLLLGDLGKLSRASIGENGDAVTPPEFGRGKSFFNES